MKKPISGLAVLGISLGVAANAGAAFIQPTSISTTAGNIYNTPAVLIDDASGNGGVAYEAPNPSAGGAGTSWYTASSGTTPVALAFEFASVQSLDELYLWDYYNHTPTQWNLKLFSGASGTGAQLLNLDFTITPGPDKTSTKHILDFSNVGGSFSGILTTENDSAKGGVGLAEIGFTQGMLSTPLPAAAWLLGSGLLVLLGIARKKNA